MALYTHRESAEQNEKNLKIKIEKARAKLSSEEIVFEKNFAPLRKELDQFEVELNQNFNNFYSEIYQQVIETINEMEDEIDFDYSDDEQQQGLNFQRIQQFERFQADESFVGNQCVICMEDFEIGRNMMRLDCDGQHTFCQVCIEGWFADHNTCPICRHTF